MITKELLIKHKACEEQLNLFNELFPNGAKLTKASWNKAIKNGLEVNWLERVLTGEYLAEYERVLQPAWAEYLKVQQPAWAEYLKVQQPAWAEYLKVQQPARAEYEKVQRLALFHALKRQYK